MVPVVCHLHFGNLLCVEILQYALIKIMIIFVPQVSYVLDTEDLLVRFVKRRRHSYGGNLSCRNQAHYLNKYAVKVQRFHRLMSSS